MVTKPVMGRLSSLMATEANTSPLTVESFALFLNLYAANLLMTMADDQPTASAVADIYVSAAARFSDPLPEEREAGEPLH